MNDQPVIFEAGIHRSKAFVFGPCTYQAAPGARVILTGLNDEPPAVAMSDGTILDGLWIGGLRDKGGADAITPGGAGQTVARNRQFRNCTIFGYRSGIAQGTAEYMAYQNNRFVLNGEGTHYHALYVSGADGQGPGQSNHSIVDGNLFVGGEGYAIHGWHDFRNAIVIRNAIFGHCFGLALDGTDHYVQNNLFWKQLGYPPTDPFGAWLHGDNIRYIGNVHGPDSKLLASDGPNNFVSGNSDLDTLAWTDAAVSAVQASFARPIADLYADQLVEAHLSVLAACRPVCTLPTLPDDLWARFRVLGFTEYDSGGNALAAK